MQHVSPSTDLQIGMIADPLSWALWPVAKAYLDPALAESDQHWPEAEADLASEATQLWVVQRGGDLLAAAVTRITQGRKGEVAEVFLVGGRDFRRWIGPLNDVIATSARQIGCVALRAYGRIGWRDILKAFGWRLSFVGYEMEL